jgi:hypothetical protein
MHNQILQGNAASENRERIQSLRKELRLAKTLLKVLREESQVEMAKLSKRHEQSIQSVELCVGHLERALGDSLKLENLRSTAETANFHLEA